jgi:hypothetical protein
MPVPCDTETAPEPREEEEEIALRLGDILPRVPAHLLKPGPHDATAQIRFSIDELAEKISRGRVSVPLDRLASVCPEVFRDSSAFPGEQEIQLPLQKLLEQVGLFVPKPSAPNGMPSDQLAQARAEAGRIIEANSASPAPDFATPPSVHAARIAKAISTARQIFGLFGRSSDSSSQDAAPDKPAPVNIPLDQQASLPASNPSPPAPATMQPAPPAQPPPEPPPEPIPPGCISVRVLPIFRLLPGQVLRSVSLPPEKARVILPLSAIDPQLAGGHVEIPVEDFVKALPEALRRDINPIPGTQVWIPLDEIFQNLPPDHLYYMPPIDLLAEPVAEPAKAPPSFDALPPVDAPAPPQQALRENSGRATPADPPRDSVDAPPPPAPPTPEPIPKSTGSSPVPEIPSTPPAAKIPATAPEVKAEAAPPPAATLPPDPKPAEPAPIETPAEPPAAASAPPPSRAPWMRGFQVPPPRLFSGGVTSSEPASSFAPIEPLPPAPATPEAKRTIDFIANQPGVFAAAAFVEGAVFASADFPRKPDLDALRDFMGAFTELALESGRRLGWNRVLTIACQQIHLTAVVRDTHFIVALHHDRVLSAPTHDALIAAADDLSKVAR